VARVASGSGTQCAVRNGSSVTGSGSGGAQSAVGGSAVAVAVGPVAAAERRAAVVLATAVGAVHRPQTAVQVLQHGRWGGGDSVSCEL
jgi:hypothetical protein